MKIIASILILTVVLLVAKERISAQTPSGVVSPSPISSKALSTLITRLEAVLRRADNINQRISSRLLKSNLKNQSYATLAGRISKSKAELTQLERESQVLSTKAFSKQDHLLFRSQVTTFIKNLKDIYSLELSIVSDMKKGVTNTPSPTVTKVPTP